MKPGIHPSSYGPVSIACACGTKYETQSTKSYNIEVCAACHPFFTGKAKFVDTEGRVERFLKKYGQGEKK